MVLTKPCSATILSCFGLFCPHLFTELAFLSVGLFVLPPKFLVRCKKLEILLLLGSRLLQNSATRSFQKNSFSSWSPRGLLSSSPNSLLLLVCLLWLMVVPTVSSNCCSAVVFCHRENQGKAVASGFHGETSESEVEQLLRETIEIGMSIENVRIECPAKPITHAFIYFKNISEYVEERVEREEDKDDSINERRRKISSEKTGIYQILHSRETWHSSRLDFTELDLKIRVGRLMLSMW